MDPRSEANLAQVHPDLAGVMRAAAQTPEPFIVTYGIRTIQAEEQAVATGHSQTLHSRHLPDANFGYVAMAVDVDDAINFHADPAFASGHEAEVFGAIAAQVHAAALAAVAAGTLRKTPSGEPALQWGGQPIGAWRDGQPSGFRDWGHFQLDPSAYA